MKKKILLLLGLVLSGLFLATMYILANPSIINSKTTPSSTVIGEKKDTKEPKRFQVERHPNDLPKDADSAPTDKIYATDGSEVYYASSRNGQSISAPEFKGYTPDKVKEILGQPEKIVTAASEMDAMLKQDERKRVTDLMDKNEITPEEAKAFLLTSINFSINLGKHFIIYEYTTKNIVLLFDTADNTLLYVTPNPAYVYWR